MGGARIIAVLEPRSNTMKLGTMKAQLPASVAAADRVFCYAGNLGWDAAAAFAPLGAKATVIDDLDALVDAIARDAHAGDHVVVMSNGGFGGIHDKLLQRLAGRERVTTIVYLHGFRSSPASAKAQAMRARGRRAARASAPATARSRARRGSARGDRSASSRWIERAAAPIAAAHRWLHRQLARRLLRDACSPSATPRARC